MSFIRRSGWWLVAERGGNPGAVDGFMAAGRPTGALLYSSGMIGPADQQATASDTLEMTFQAEVVVANSEEFGINGSVRIVASRAPFTDGFVFKDKRTALGLVTAETAFIFGEQTGNSANAS